MPLYLNPKSGRFTTTKLSLGALGDSYYEYLLKMWILKGRSPADEMYRTMWQRAMDEMIEKLVFTSSHGNLTYVAEFDRSRESWWFPVCSSVRRCFQASNIPFAAIQSALRMCGATSAVRESRILGLSYLMHLYQVAYDCEQKL